LKRYFHPKIFGIGEHLKSACKSLLVEIPGLWDLRSLAFLGLTNWQMTQEPMHAGTPGAADVKSMHTKEQKEAISEGALDWGRRASTLDTKSMTKHISSDSLTSLPLHTLLPNK